MNLNPPTLPNIQTAVLDAQTGGFSVTWYQYLDGLRQRMTSFPPLNLQEDFGARMDGSDDTGPYQNAINALVTQGGGILVIPQGTVSTYTVTIPPNAPPIWIIGSGFGTVHQRRGALMPGHGLLDIYSSNVSISNMVIDGMTTTPTGLQYGVGFNGINGNDPYAASLTTNTSLWLHGGTSNLSLQSVRFQHAGGYSVLLDATTATISDVQAQDCQFLNNRPTLFGTNPAALIYGSWNGGILAKGDGRTVGSGVVKGLSVSNCRFERNTGNCLWSHVWGLNALHSDFRLTNNSFLDCGLDGILIGGVTGGIVALNTFRRIGYTTTNDTSQSIPRWLSPSLNATALDSAGLVKGVNYVCNSFTSINGGCIDLDGHCYSSIVGNVCRVPYSYEVEFSEDQIEITGPTNSGSNSYGINFNNTNQTEEGATNVEISSNQFINLPAGAARLYAARRVHFTCNNIEAPSNSIIAPVSFGPVGPGPYQRCYNLRVCHNNFDYSPGSSAPCVLEDSTYSAFLGSEANAVFGNVPITPSGSLAFEFQKAAGSGSVVYSMQPWFT